MVGGMRGGFGVTVRPIGINDANLYIEKPVEAGIVLNTAFSMYKTIDNAPLVEPDWFETTEELEEAFSPVHVPALGGEMQKKNVVILILESFSASYSAYLTELQGERRGDYMPFLDSLMKESLVFRYSFANGRLSIDAQPSVMCGIPAFVESFTLTPYANNDIRGLARELGEKGYSSAFYHGAQRQSLALAGFAHKSGFQQEFSRESYGNEDDFDGTWGIWDEPFLQYFEQGIGELQEPFLATVFTLSSHHPYAIPSEYESVFESGTIPIHRCVRYSDYAIRRFFESARKEPWFGNTLFVITGDHTNQTDAPEYRTLAGVFEIPILFYTPDGTLKGLRDGIAMQLDIKPTILSYLGYDEPWFSFGCDLLTTPDEETYAVHYQSGMYLYEQDGYQLQFDGEKSVGLYRFTEDRLLEENLLLAEPERVAAMERRIKAIIQQYARRMIHNELTAVPAA
jgi:phosphoglycerol transferase MdoB-like AlkP superfamily enzyme